MKNNLTTILTKLKQLLGKLNGWSSKSTPPLTVKSKRATEMEKQRLKTLIDAFKQVEVLENIIDDLNKAAILVINEEQCIKITVETRLKQLPEKPETKNLNDFFDALSSEMAYFKEIKDCKRAEMMIEIFMDDKSSMKVMGELIRVMAERKANVLKEIDSLNK